MLAEIETGALFVVEVVAWSLPALVAVVLARRSPQNCRMVWMLVAAACALIVLDKAVDIHRVMHRVGQIAVVWIDPEHRFRGPMLIYRFLLLGSLFLVGCFAMIWVVRRDRDLNRPKLIATLGIVMVMAYLALRLIPGLAGVFTGWRAWAMEVACYVLVVGGEYLGFRRRT